MVTSLQSVDVSSARERTSSLRTSMPGATATAPSLVTQMVVFLSVCVQRLQQTNNIVTLHDLAPGTERKGHPIVMRHWTVVVPGVMQVLGKCGTWCHEVPDKVAPGVMRYWTKVAPGILRYQTKVVPGVLRHWTKVAPVAMRYQTNLHLVSCMRHYRGILKMNEKNYSFQLFVRKKCNSTESKVP